MLRRVLGAIWRYKWLSLAILVVGLSAAVLVPSMLVKPRYSAQATIWVEGDAGNRQGPIQTAPAMNSQGWVELVRSFAVIEPVVHELRLYIEPGRGAEAAHFASVQLDSVVEFGAYRFEVSRAGDTFTLSSPDGRVHQRGRVGEAVGVSLGFRWQPPADLLRAGRSVDFVLRDPRDAAHALRQTLQVSSRDRSNLLYIGLVGREADGVARTINAVSTRFVDLAGELKRAQSEELTRILEEQLQHAARNLRESEAALQGFRVTTVTLPSDRVLAQAPGLQATQGTVFSDFFMLKMEREQLRRDRQSIQEALEQGRNGTLSVSAFEIIPSVQGSSELREALRSLAAKRAELRAMQAQFTDQFLPVQRLAEEVRVLETQAIPRQAALLVTDIRTREAEMDRRLGAASGELRQIPERSIEEGRLERSKAIAEDLYTMLSGRYETARLAAVSAVADVRMLDPAKASGTPVNENERLRLLMMILAGSLGLALVLPVALDRIDSRLRYPEQVTHDLGLPILGAVPHVATAPNGKPRQLKRDTSTAIEAFREIRLNLSHAFGTAGPLITTVTSPGAGDGKSFITANLALAFADLGHATLLIDGDTRRGQMHRLLGGVRVPGLTDYLAGSVSGEEVIQPTAYASLDMIAAGTRMQAGPELLGSSAMTSLMRDLRGRYSVILVDSPPLGAGVDPFLLSTLTGNALLVLRTGRTDREFALAKLDLLDRLPVRLLGAVLNDVPATGAYRYYSYLPGYAAEGEGELPRDGGVRELEGAAQS